MGTRKNSILLGGVEYYIRGPVIAQPVSDFAANIRIGEESYDARQGAGFNIFDDFSGGPGIMLGLSREDLARFSRTTGVDTRIPRQMTLPFKATAGTGIAGGAGNQFARRKRIALTYEASGAAVRLTMISGTHIYSVAPNAAAWFDQGEPKATKKIEDMEMYLPVEGVLGGSSVARVFVVCNDTTAAPNNRGVMLVTPGSDPTDLQTITESFPAQTLIAYDNKLLIQSMATFTIGGAAQVKAGKVYATLDGSTLVKDSGGVQPDPIWSLPPTQHGRFIGPARAPNGELAPYYIANQLYWCDFYARRVYLIPLPVNDIRAATTWQDGLVLTDGLHIVHYVPGDPGIVRPIDLVRDQGFLRGETWWVDALFGDAGGFLYAHITDGTSMWLWEYRGAAWHPIGKKQTGIPAGLLLTDTSKSNWGLGAPQRRIWQFSTTPTSFYTDWPAGSDTPLVGTAHFENDAGGYVLETPWLDGGFRELQGAAFQLWGAGTFPTGTSVKVEYAVDLNEPTYYTLGTFTAVGHYNFNHNATGSAAGVKTAGQVFTTIKFRFTLYGKATDDTLTPNPIPMTFVFRKKPGLRMAYLFHIDVSRQIETGTVDKFLTTYNELKVLWNTKTLVTFSYADITETKVDIVSMPSAEQELRAAKRRGRISVQVMEPIDF